MKPMNQFVSGVISVGEDLAAVAERLRRCTVEVRGIDSGRGSGVIWRSDGLIVTNAHVATSSEHAVQLADGRVFKAELIRRDRRLDLAVLQIDCTGLPAVQVRDATSLRTGELVIAVGNPMGTNGALSIGLVSTKTGDMLVKADIRLAPGNSGGPLADSCGRVVGINCMVVDGFGIAVSSAAVERLLASADATHAEREEAFSVRPRAESAVEVA
jgi:serine protease Do